MAACSGNGTNKAGLGCAEAIEFRSEMSTAADRDSPMSTDPFAEILADAVNALDQVGAVYAVTGSMASSLHGVPQSSLDVDVIVQMTEQQARSLARQLPEHIYRDEESIATAARDHSMANMMDMRSGVKLDLSVASPEPFFSTVFSRRMKAAFEFGGPKYWVVTPEDVILMKLLWRRESQSQKQWESCLGVVRVNGAKLDWSYLTLWADRLGLARDLAKLKLEGGI
jgi:hypothetical protein